MGAIIENSVKISDLSLVLQAADYPRAFCDSFANCIHVQSLFVSVIGQTTNDQTNRYTFWSKMVANDNRNGPLERLLRNPQHQLKELKLGGNGLGDRCIRVIAQLLPLTHIELIELTHNNIQAPGLLGFARHLPKMNSLAAIFLGDNPWEESSVEVLHECGAALLHGLIENPSILHLRGMDTVPQRPLLWHYHSLNRAGRKILISPSYVGKPFPDGLWSRAGRPTEMGGRSHIPICDGYGKYKYNIMVQPMPCFFFLRNCPKILSWQLSI